MINIYRMDDIRNPLIINAPDENSDNLDTSGLKTLESLKIPNFYSKFSSDDSNEEVSDFSSANSESQIDNKDFPNKSSEKIRTKHLYLTIFVASCLSVLFTFVSGYQLGNLVTNESYRDIVFFYSPYICFLVSFIISVLLYRNIISHINDHRKKYEVLSLASFAYFYLFSSCYIGENLDYFNLSYSYLLRILFLGFILLTGYIYDSVLTRVISSFFCGFIESFFFYLFEFNMNLLMLGAVLTLANFLYIKLVKDYKIGRKKNFMRKKLLFVCFLALTIINGPLLVFMSTISFYLNSS